MAERIFKLDFKPNPIQQQFIESRAMADLFSSRFGEGKSTALSWSAYYHTRHNPGARWALIRDTTINLQRTTQKEFFKWFPPGIMGTYRASDKEFHWASGIGEGEVLFLGLDDPKDASKLQSLELAGFGIDEAAPAAESGGVDELIFDMGMARLRQPGMNWYAAKVVENNPDEGHWTYPKFVDPGTRGFMIHHPITPENVRNLPDGYYANLRYLWRNRPDLVRRFIEGQYGFQQIGKAVTPEWEDRLHLGLGLVPVRGPELVLLWDFGLNPTCLITQVTPLGHWNVLDAMVGEGIGVEELIVANVAPLMRQKYRGYTFRHIGDPQGTQREQSSSEWSAVRVIRRKLGGHFRAGPKSLQEGVQPLRAVLRQTVGGTGLVQVDRDNAKPVWYALRGGWHYHVTRTGLTSGDPLKNIHSHPGDAMRYGAGLLYPLAKVQGQKTGRRPQAASYFQSGAVLDKQTGLGFERPMAKIPEAGKVLRGA